MLMMGIMLGIVIFVAVIMVSFVSQFLPVSIC